MSRSRHNDDPAEEISLDSDSDEGFPFTLQPRRRMRLTSDFRIGDEYDTAKGIYRVFATVRYTRYGGDEVHTLTTDPMVYAIVGFVSMDVMLPTQDEPVQLGSVLNPLPSFAAELKVLPGARAAVLVRDKDVQCGRSLRKPQRFFFFQ